MIFYEEELCRFASATPGHQSASDATSIAVLSLPWFLSSSLTSSSSSSPPSLSPAPSFDTVQRCTREYAQAMVEWMARWKAGRKNGLTRRVSKMTKKVRQKATWFSCQGLGGYELALLQRNYCTRRPQQQQQQQQQQGLKSCETRTLQPTIMMSEAKSPANATAIITPAATTTGLFLALATAVASSSESSNSPPASLESRISCCREVTKMS